MFSELTVSSQVLVNPGLQQSGWAHNLYEVVFPSGQAVDDGRARYGRARYDASHHIVALSSISPMVAVI